MSETSETMAVAKRKRARPVSWAWMNSAPYTLYAREKLGAPEGWVHWMLSCSRDDAPEGWFVMEGGVVAIPPIGKPKFSQATDKRRLFARFADFHAWEEEHGARLDECPKCRGKGEEWTGWDHIEGHSYRPCTRCNATGKYIAHAPEPRP